jgi:adenylate cyclase
MAMRFVARGRFRVRPDQLWPLVSDTHRMNRAMGLPVMSFRAEPRASGGSVVIGEHPAGSSLLAFLNQVVPLGAARVTDRRVLRWLPSWPITRWIEHPFEFEAPRRYSVLREYFWAPLGLFPFRSVRATVELVATGDGGTDVVSSADVVPRNRQGALVARLVVGPRSCRAVVEQCRNFERYLLGQAEHPFPDLVVGGGEPTPAAPAAPSSAGASIGQPPAEDREEASAGRQGEAADAWERLARAGVPPELAGRLRRHLETAPDDEVLKMRPFELADRWGVDRRQALVTCLRGTTAGLLEMSWDVLCPGCRISKLSVASLDAVKGEVHCDFCNISFDAAIDQQVEVRFSVAERLRRVEDRRFCSGGPMNTPHVIAQAELQPGEARPIEAHLPVGVVRVRSLQSRSTAIVDVQAGGQAGEVGLTVRPEAIVPPASAAAPGAVRLRVENRTDVPVALVVEDPGWPDTAATASVVATIQEFRDLFDAQVLAPGLQLAIQRLAFLFTDLTGSTALYQRVGQARAFRLVQDHFRILFEAVTTHRGAVVKTIGDAVMAVFPTAADAVACALAMQRQIRRLETDGAVDPGRLLKIGIHEGPCIAVTANGRLDYFGTTINTAARVEHECRGGQIVMTGEVHMDPAVQALVRGAGLTLETTEVQLRGVDEPVRLHRVAAPVVEAAAVLPTGTAASQAGRE